MFDGRNDTLSRKHFLEFGQRFGVAKPAIEARLDRMTERARPFVAAVARLDLEAKRERQLRDLMATRLDAIAE